MSNGNEPMDAFNNELDRLLNGAAPDGRQPQPGTRAALQAAALLAAVDFAAELRPRPGLKERWQRETARPQPQPHPALRWAWAALAVA
ncbi:hypothetical protein FDZ74_14740, partial [bacterium]